MTPQKKGKTRSAQPEPRASVPAARRSRKALFVAAGIALLLGAVVVVIGLRRSRSPDVVAFPPPAAADSLSITPADFTGSAACAECHASQHRAWSASTH